MGIKEDNFYLSRKFISIDQLVFELVKLENISEEEVFSWLLSKNILDELILVEKCENTHKISVVERSKPITKDNLYQFIEKSKEKAEDQFERAKSIRKLDDFINHNAEIMVNYVEKLVMAVDLAHYCTDGRDEWHFRFERWAESYYLDDMYLNTGWKRTDLTNFLKKYNIELDWQIEYPTYQERTSYLELKYKSNKIKLGKTDTLCILDYLPSDLDREKAQLKQRIAELEQQLKQSQQSQIKLDKPSSIDLLTYILDPTQENYAPDLALSIQLYKYVYIDSPRQDSHSSKANTWIKQNTDYDSSNQSGSRIREITAPLNGWNRQRDKKFIKI